MPHQQLDYEVPGKSERSRGSPRFWAAVFISSGLCALGCGVASVLADHFHLSDIEIFSRGGYLLATPVCAVSALIYLAIAGKEKGSRSARLPTRALAWIAVGIAGAFLLVLALFIVLMALSPNDF
jgi:hypothetical protein